MKIKNIVITIIVFIIIILSFIIPTIIVKLQDIVMTKEVYKRGRIEGKIDIEAEKIYLVQIIHKRGDIIQIGDSNSIRKQGMVEFTSGTSDEAQPASYNIFVRELEKLDQYSIIDGKLKQSNDDYMNVGILNKKYLNQITNPIIYCIDVSNDKNKISVEIESKTEKILYIEFDKEKMLDISKEEIMRNYVKYLDLYIIEDWRFENDMLKSDKAQLAISIVENSTTYELSVHSINKNPSLNYYSISN